MASLITLEEDGPLGPAGTRVWVDDEPPKVEEKAKSRKKKQDDES